MNVRIKVQNTKGMWNQKPEARIGNRAMGKFIINKYFVRPPRALMNAPAWGVAGIARLPDCSNI